ncbi:MAG TPA: hypothetical protein VM598_09535 [Bdellovibrionota bacterium]|nr:hypothetical protein [Bdellovibrionota bacterium]
MQLLVLALATTVSLAHAAPSIEAELAELRSDPRAYLEGQPTRFDGSGRAWAPELEIEVADKIQARRSLRPGTPETAAEPSAYDQASRVVDRLEHASLKSMESAGLRKARLVSTPWSGDYWPIYSGGLAKRYADPGFPAKRDWKVNFDYLLGALGDTDPIEHLSPAEKYDLLVGDSNWSLSRAFQNEGWKYYNGGPKSVPSWAGYCHGWAIAAYLSPRPGNAIEAVAADGRTKIPFYPHDIKALQTALWGQLALSGQIRFVGGRCESDEPARDANGRIIEGACSDTNPATWHLAVVNQIGVAKRSLTFDATLDSEVWNQPIVGYDYSYFNPKTLLPASKLEDAAVPVNELRADRFSPYRSPRARSVVGVIMHMSYTVETKPRRQQIDADADDAHVTVRYLYDLELDQNGKIIGGEWYRNRHPDFLWTPWQGSHPASQADAWIDYYHPGTKWDGKGPIPQGWQQLIPNSSAGGVPAARVVDVLTKLAGE